MVHPNLVIEALTKGADGVLILGCHPGDCHYLEGNLRARSRADAIGLMLEILGSSRSASGWSGYRRPKRRVSPK